MSKKPESKRDKFVRLANTRTNNVLDSLRVLGNLSSRKRYEYSDTDVRKIFRAIDDEVKRIKSLFESPSVRDFRLEA